MAHPVINLFFPHPHNNHKAKIFRPESLVFLIGLFIMGRSLVSIFAGLKPGVLGFASQIDPAKIVELTNKARLDAGVSKVSYNADLSAAALAKATDMFKNNYWAHISPAGVEPWYFITRSGYEYQHAGENLARDFADSNSIVKAWIASPTHKQNLLDARFKDIGIAVMDGYINGVETTIVVQMFGVKQKSTAVIASASTTNPVPAAFASENKIFPQTGITPLDLSRSWTLAFFVVIVLALALDWMFIWRNNIIRISGKTWAHLTFFLCLLAVILIIKQGVVI